MKLVSACKLKMLTSRFRRYFYFLTTNRFRCDSAEAKKSNADDTAEWQSVVGLEVHAQIQAKSKLFSNAPVSFDSPTNTEVSYFDAAFPGTLPALNKHCVEAAILTALALNCKVNRISTFDRKHYFYPDLPAGYQITQQFQPLASNGYIKFIVNKDEASYQCTSSLKQLQLEQDSGRSFHMKAGLSYVDLNRAGTGLMELVFEPDLKNGLEAAALIKELILILKQVGSCACELEKGTLRVDANVSVNRANAPLGVRTEVKNINSMRYIARAIDFEIARQIEVLERDEFVVNETRGYDYKKRITMSLRDKENLQDYRFMPEPNLPPIILYENKNSNPCENDSSALYLDEIGQRLPILPDVERQRLIKTYKLPLDAVDRLLHSDGAKEIFESIATHVSNYEYICEFLLRSLKYHLNINKTSFSQCPLTSQQLGSIIELIVSKKISEMTGKDILQMLYNGDHRSPLEIVETYGWFQICDGKELEKLCKEVMVSHPKHVRKFMKTGKYRLMTALLNSLNMKVSNRANTDDAEMIFKRLMEEKKTLKGS